MTQFFTPENWASLGYNLFITRKEILFQPSLSLQRYDKMPVQKDYCNFYDFPLLDMS